MQEGLCGKAPGRLVSSFRKCFQHGELETGIMAFGEQRCQIGEVGGGEFSVESHRGILDQGVLGGEERPHGTLWDGIQLRGGQCVEDCGAGEVVRLGLQPFEQQLLCPFAVVGTDFVDEPGAFGDGELFIAAPEDLREFLGESGRAVDAQLLRGEGSLLGRKEG